MDEVVNNHEGKPLIISAHSLKARGISIFFKETALTLKKKGRADSSLLEEVAERDQWLHSQDSGLHLLGIDLKTRVLQAQLQKNKESQIFNQKYSWSWSRTKTPDEIAAVEDKIAAVEKELEETTKERETMSPYMDDELRQNNIVPLILADLKLEHSEVNYQQAISWLEEHQESKELIDFYRLLQARKQELNRKDHAQRNIESALQIETWRFREQDTKNMRGLDRDQRELISRALVNTLPSDQQEIIGMLQSFSQFIREPSIQETLSDVVALYSEHYRKTLLEKFKNGEISFVPNDQQNMRSLLIVDLIRQCLRRDSIDFPKVVNDWQSYWSQSFTSEHTLKFLNLIIDCGYKRGDPVNDRDRKIIVERWNHLVSPSAEEIAQTDATNRRISEQPTNVIPVSEFDLFHDSDFSALDRIVQNGVVANELTMQSRNANAGRESDLAASFWRLQRYGTESGLINLSDAISIFYPKEGRIVQTGASLKHRIVIGFLNPGSLEDREFFLYPPYSDDHDQVMKLIGNFQDFPLSDKFIAGMEINNIKTSIKDVHRDGVFALLGVAQTKTSFVIIPDGIKAAYVQKAAQFPYYLPAFSAQTGELIFTPKEYDDARHIE